MKIKLDLVNQPTIYLEALLMVKTLVTSLKSDSFVFFYNRNSGPNFLSYKYCLRNDYA